MNLLEKTFIKFLKHENLTGKKLLLSVSGGVDSMVLLHVASKTISTALLSVFHLDHGARAQSKKDLLFVQKNCSIKKIKFYEEHLKTLPAKNREEFWRKERKRLSQKAQKDFGAVRILTAHHATDLVETMLFRLTKGCGAGGLSPFDTSTKPFWNVPKSDIEQYAKKYNVQYITDESNEDVTYERNLIRHKVVPELRKITPNLEKVFVTESEIFGETEKFIMHSVGTCHGMSLQTRNRALPEFLALPVILQSEFLRLIAKRPPSFDETSDCLRWLHNNPKGNSTKTIGGTKIQLKQNMLHWEGPTPCSGYLLDLVGILFLS
ncbi:tRNA lysidine(34) synthetase TilS [Candidatus Gracilibacteria bacterium]|nr:tRNA lysidine(34) synthetase TilS [Candidatus Gracilibacteria bacterium]